MTFLGLILAAAVSLAPLDTVVRVDLSASGSAASDVAWLNDHELLVALIKGGVVKVTLPSRAVTPWVPEGPLPGGAPYAELIAADRDLVVVMGGGKRNYAFRKPDGKYLYGYMGGRLNPRGVAVSGGKAFLLGWMSKAGGADEGQQRGVLWTEVPDESVQERPLHRIVTGDDALSRWRRTIHPYGGAAVALPDGTVAFITSAEPGIFHYDRNGKLLEVLGSGIDSLVLDSPRLVESFAVDILGRYREVLNRQPTIDDLVVMPEGLAVLVRVVTGDTIQWQLWMPNRTGVARIRPLSVKANGPIGHMKCEARGPRLACVTNLPDPRQAAEPGPAGANPTLLFFQVSR